MSSLAAWCAHLQELPQEPWDILTDFPRDTSSWQETLGADVVKDVIMRSTPLASDLDWDLQCNRLDELSILTAVCVALGNCDHGRSMICVLDKTRIPGAGLPLKVDIVGSVQDVRGTIDRERERVAALWQDVSENDGTSEAAVLAWKGLSSQSHAASQRTSMFCQVALQRGHAWESLHEEKFPPDICVFLDGSSIHLACRGDLFRAETGKAIAAHATELLRIQKSWSSLRVEAAGKASIQHDELAQLLKGWQGNSPQFNEDSCIHHLFEREARGAAASRIALIPFDKSEMPWSYAQLDIAAGQVAKALLSLGVEPGSRSPILLRRSCLLVAAIYGTLRAGQAYVPLDPDWPTHRQRVVIEDVDAATLVLGAGLQVPVECEQIPSVRLSASPGSAMAECPAVVEISSPLGQHLRDRLTEEASAHVTADMTVYILYTSGTTGRPKGVDVPHCGLVGRTRWLQNTWPLGPEEVVAQKTPATFAISEWELFWPLCFGAKLVMAADGLHGDPQHVARLLLDHAVSHTVFVPSLLEQLLDELDGRDLPALQLIIACGEALKASTALASLRCLPKAELVNLYGPTEGSMTMLRLPPTPTVEHLFRCPIGVPIENTLVLCMADPAKGPEYICPVLAKGELLFGGPLIASGYWRRPELTEEKFVDNPHAPGKAYRTGDLGRWRADGSLEFLGRADNQVKFNGVRIELSEIEAALAALPRVRSTAAFLAPPHHLVVVCTVTGTSAAKRGSAATFAPEPEVTVDTAVHGGEKEERSLLEGLQAALPKDRVPTRLQILPSLPVTDRGKVDRQKLLDGFLQHESKRAGAKALSVSRCPPTPGEISSTEVKLEELMKDVMGVTEPMPTTLSFQELGFSSLLLGKLTTRIRRTFALPGLPATAVYKHPCVQALAEFVDLMVKEQDAENSKSDDVKDRPQELVQAAKVWHGGSPISALSCVCTITGLLLDCIVSEFAFLPAYYLFFEIYQRFGLLVVCMSAGAILIVDMMLTLLIIVLLKWLIIGRRREGNFPVFSWYYWQWKFMVSIERYAEEHMNTYLADTPLYNLLFRLHGAKIGPGVRVNYCHLSELDLLSIGAGARIERDATLCPARIWNGELQLRRIVVGEGALISHRAYMAGGTSLPPNMEVTAMSSSDPSGPYHVKPREQMVSDDIFATANKSPLEWLQLEWLQLVVGMPIIFLVETLSEVPVFFALEQLWSVLARRLSAPFKERQQSRHWGWGMWTGHKSGFTLEDKRHVIYPYVALIPWVMTFVHGGAYFLLVVGVKKLVVGKFGDGRVLTNWDRFCRWLMERLTTTATFNHFMELWVNTEMLSSCYRLLGAHVATRVNMDVFGAVEYDLIHIETDVVFGSSVLLVNTSGGISRCITLRKGACVLDHSCLLPGTVVPEGALLGSFTVVPSGQQLEPMTIYTGNERGACVRLFQRPLLPGERIEGERLLPRGASDLALDAAEGAPPLPPPAARQRALEAQAAMYHWSMRFYLFNLWCGASAVLFAPLPDVVYWATIIIDFEIYDYFGNSDLGEMVSVLMIGPLYIMVNFGMLAVLCALKWVLIGRWQAGDRPYYTWFHFRWAALMVAFSSLNSLLESISGTWLAVAFLRMMGATVGQNVCFFGHGFEFDLLHIGDEVCIGRDCDVTAHTVENMVMRMEFVRFERGASCLGQSVVMPGGLMEQGSTLIEHSQVLKGEAVPTNAFFGGLPATLLKRYAGLDEPWAPQLPHDGGQAGGSRLPLLADRSSSTPKLARPGLSSPSHNCIEIPQWRCSHRDEARYERLADHALV